MGRSHRAHQTPHWRVRIHKEGSFYMNYVKLLRAEIAEAELHLSRLQIALSVIEKIQSSELVVTREPAAERTEPAKKRRSNYNPGGLMRTRKAVLAYLETQTHPVRSRAIMDAVMPAINATDSTFWAATKQLRDEGRIMWDTETRLYTIVRSPMKKEA
jgi:hypothetical protein